MDTNLFEFTKKKIIIYSIVGIGVIFLCCLGYYMSHNNDSTFLFDNNSTTVSKSPEALVTDKQQSPKPQETQIPKDEIKIYVIGCVKNPGIVTLKKGQIINDAINAAGGATIDADLENINLVYELKENSTIKIKSKSERLNSGVQIITGSEGALLNENKDQQNNSKIININTATIEELDSLPGIGKSTAQKILAYRDSNGVFKTKEDIMKIPGIGKSKYESIKDLITAK